MKRLLLILALTLAAGCASVRPQFFSVTTPYPEHYIDSLAQRHRIDIDSRFKLWPCAQFLTSDSTLTNLYTTDYIRRKARFVLSVTEYQPNNLFLLKFRREHK